MDNAIERDLEADAPEKTKQKTDKKEKKNTTGYIYKICQITWFAPYFLIFRQNKQTNKQKD